MSAEHPARAAGLASQAAVRARDKDAWLALFAAYVRRIVASARLAEIGGTPIGSMPSPRFQPWIGGQVFTTTRN